MTNLGSDNCIAPVGADRFVQSRFCGRSIILALKWTNAKIVLQFAKMFPPRFVTSRISGECLWFAANLRGDEGEHVWRQDFLRTKNATWKSQISKMRCEPQSVCVSASLPISAMSSQENV